MADEEEVRLEVEAAQAVYGDDCHVIQEFPPHLTVHITPRTAEDSSQQFVEAVIGIKSSSQYPTEPPHLYIIDTKGLDVSRQTYLMSRMQQKAKDLSSCLMIVALCEEAVEILTNMNHPEGNCPLCLYPLVALTGDKTGSCQLFMKLMSCYHCFHSECIVRWWKWLREEEKTTLSESSDAKIGVNNQRKGNCPVCRMEFYEIDIEHVLDYLGTDSNELANEAEEMDEYDNELLESESENNRRKQFDELLRLQQEKNGLIEPKKDLLILPGMFIPLPSVTPTNSENEGNPVTTDQNANSSKQKNMNMRRKHNNNNNNNNNNNRARNSSRKQQNTQNMRKQWVQRGGGDSSKR